MLCTYHYQRLPKHRCLDEYCREHQFVVLDDLGSELLYDGITAINVVIPTNLSVPFPVGTSFYSLATNTGVLSISAAPGVVLKYKA